jgi:LysM repeat protein
MIMAEKKKKSILDQMIDAVTDRDEKAAAKAAAEKAAADKAAAEKAAAENAIQRQKEYAAKLAADKAAAEKAAAEKAAAEKAAAERAALAKAEAEKAAARAALPEYKVAADDTLSHIALKYYGNAGRDFWMLIYEANKDVIGDNPGIIRPGTVLKIPVLPDHLKAK